MASVAFPSAASAVPVGELPPLAMACHIYRLLDDLRQLEQAEGVICLKRGAELDPNPKTVYGGKMALLYLCQRLKYYLGNWYGNSYQFRAQRFFEQTENDLSLFATLPLDSFPPDHPFHLNGGMKLLQQEQRQAKLQPEADPKVVWRLSGRKVRSLICVLGAEEDKYCPMPKKFGIKHFTCRSVEELLLDPTTGFEVAYDQERNIWVTARALRALLFTPPK